MGTPGFDGWYGIAGDHPTDVVPLNYFPGEPRVILHHFVQKWQRAAAKLAEGQDYGDFNIEQIEERPAIGALIADRAARLQSWVEADELWHDVVVNPVSLPTTTDKNTQEEVDDASPAPEN